MGLRLIEQEGAHAQWMETALAVARPATAHDFEQFGAILAYAFLFGLQDLHRENAVLTAGGLQVLDVESVFSDLQLPNQTLMLATHDSNQATAALNLLGVPLLELLLEEQARTLLKGFVGQCGFIYERRAAFKELFAAHHSEFLKHDIRLFFRRTKDYAEHRAGRFTLLDVMPEEQTQLDRGDVPFFFSRLGERRIFYYATDQWGEREVNYPEPLAKYVDYTRVAPGSLLTEKALAQKWAVGVLYLVRKMNVGQEPLDWGTCRIIADAQSLIFERGDYRLKTKRQNSREPS